MKLRFAERELELGGDSLGYLRDSNALRGNFAALRARMEEDGYLLLRGLHNVEKVRAVRRFLLEKLAENDQIDGNYPLEEGVVREGARGGFMGGSKVLTRDPIFLNLVESPEIMGFFAHFLQGDSMTYDYKWLRVVGPGDFTGAHYDIVYMGRGTQNVFTCWTPITDVPYEMGPLALLVGSHRSEGFERVRATYGQMDVDRDKVTGWFSSDPLEMVEKFGGKWATSEFQMGDVLIFGMYTMHASLTNVSNRFRITTDTRYQRADEPADERWIGENPIAHYAWTQGDTVTMEEARQRWQI
jgi:hypothetical protein